MTKPLAEAEALFREAERISNEIRSRELLQMARETIDDYRQIIESLRRLYH